MQIGLPVSYFAQMLAVFSLAIFVAPKNSRIPMSARIFAKVVFYKNPGLIV
jgi:hypothetical protein